MVKKKVIIFFGVLILCVFLGYLVLSMLAGIQYERINNGKLYEKYVGKCFYFEDPSENNNVNSYLYKLYVNHKGAGYYLSSCSFLPEISNNESNIINIPPDAVYEVIDLYKCKSISGNLAIALCCFTNIDSLNDIVFEEIVKDFDNVFEARCIRSNWTMERYYKVINSSRCDLRGIKKDIKPGNLKKKVSGSWWNFKIWKAY